MIWLVRLPLFLISLGWLSALVRSLRASRKPKFNLSPSDDACSPDLSISVIVPARNEASNIEACLRSALAQDHPRLQVVALDDASDDGTGAILDRLASEDERLVGLHGDGSPLPDGWFGKPWALQRAQREAVGDWLAFIDADVELHPAALSRAVCYAESNGLQMVTGLGELVMETFWEKVLQPAVGGLILAGNSLSEVNDPEKPEKNLANGQFILISREAYDAIGGHAAVKDNILDDIGLARVVSAKGFHYHCLHLGELFSCRMYTSLSEIWEGWTKNLFAGLRYSWLNVLLAVMFTLSFSVLGHLLLLLGLFSLVGVEWLLWGALISGMCQAVRLVMDRRRGQSLAYGLSHAPANLIVAALILNSAFRSRRGTVRWKGRIYKPEA
jgi:chlorobactene glucosyltransferase